MDLWGDISNVLSNLLDIILLLEPWKYFKKVEKSRKKVEEND